VAAASTWRAELGAPIPPDEQPDHDGTLSAARAALTDADYQRASVAGQHLPIQEAVEMAAASLTLIESSSAT
jgi:hypothetical protein